VAAPFIPELTLPYPDRTLVPVRRVFSALQPTRPRFAITASASRTAIRGNQFESDASHGRAFLLRATGYDGRATASAD